MGSNSSSPKIKIERLQKMVKKNSLFKNVNTFNFNLNGKENNIDFINEGEKQGNLELIWRVNFFIILFHLI